MRTLDVGAMRIRCNTETLIAHSNDSSRAYKRVLTCLQAHSDVGTMLIRRDAEALIAVDAATLQAWSHVFEHAPLQQVRETETAQMRESVHVRAHARERACKREKKIDGQTDKQTDVQRSINCKFLCACL